MEAVKNGLCLAAGILTYVRDNLANKLLGSVPYDLKLEGLNLYINLLLAEAQACYYELAKAKGMKPEALSKLSGGAADLYRGASSNFQGAERTEVNRSFPWHAHCDSWAALFDAASFYRWSEKLLAEAEASGQGYGERVAWLSAAENACGAAISIPSKAAAAAAASGSSKGSGASPVSSIFGSSKSKQAESQVPEVDVSSARALLNDVQRDKAEAVADNNKIYFQLVPKLSDLPALPRAQMAKPTPLPDLTPASAGMRELFSAIVPAEVAATLAILNDRLVGLVTQAKERASKASDDARSQLQSMGLPGYLDASGAGAGGADNRGLPSQVWERVVRCQVAGGMPELDRLWGANSGSAASAGEVLRQAQCVVDDECAQDSQYRSQYGQRWTATPAEIVTSDLKGDLAKYQTLLQAASGSDQQIRAKLEGYRPVLVSLSRSRAEFDASIPAGYEPRSAASGSESAAADEADAVRSVLRGAIDELNKLIDARPRICNDIKDKFDRGAAANALVHVPQSDHGNVIETILTLPIPAQRQLDDNFAAQARILETIATAHQRFQEVRNLDERTRARERAIQSVCEAVDKFEEVRSNLREGESFWSELKTRAEALHMRCKDMMQARSMQRRELLMGMQGSSMDGSGSGSGGASGAGQSMYPPSGASATAVPIQQQQPASTNPFDQFPGHQQQQSSSLYRSDSAGSIGQGTVVMHPDTARSYASSTGAGGGASAPSTLQPSWQQQQYGGGPSGYQQQIGGGGGGGGWSSWGPSAGTAPGGGMHGPSASAMPMSSMGMQHQQQYGPGPMGGMQQPPPSMGMGHTYAASVPSAGMPPSSFNPQQAQSYAAAQSQLMGMGFSREKADWALNMHKGDFNGALNQLLTEGV